MVDWELLESCRLLCFVIETSGNGVDEHAWHVADSLLDHTPNCGSRINILITKFCSKLVKTVLYAMFTE